MATVPITDESGTVVDEYEDGTGEDVTEAVEAGDDAAALHSEQGAPGEEVQSVPAASVGAAPAPSQPWFPPSVLKGDLFLGVTIHDWDGNARGPLVSLCLPRSGGQPVVKTYRAADLTRQHFLDGLQSGIAAAFQAHLLALAEQERKRLEEEAKRKARATVPRRPAAQGTNVPAGPPAAPGQAAGPAAPAAQPAVGPSPAAKGAGKAGAPNPYQQGSMFD